MPSLIVHEVGRAGTSGFLGKLPERIVDVGRGAAAHRRREHAATGIVGIRVIPISLRIAGRIVRVGAWNASASQRDYLVVGRRIGLRISRAPGLGQPVAIRIIGIAPGLRTARAARNPIQRIVAIREAIAREPRVR
jgi:hypothetical protein